MSTRPRRSQARPRAATGARSAALPEDGRLRVVISGVSPEVECGRFAVKRTIGEELVVEADVFADGHDELSCVLLWRPMSQKTWQAAPMSLLVNDRWRGSFAIERLEPHLYTLRAWVDPFRTWARDLRKRVDAGQDVDVELIVGAELVEAAAQRARRAARDELLLLAGVMRNAESPDERIRAALSAQLAERMAEWSDDAFATTYGRELRVHVERERARFSTWYEMFPRSCAAEPGRHGTFADCARLLPYISHMGFDVLYLPPIHPIGRAFRKGRNNSTTAEPGDVGSPWGIGSQEGGHCDVHPQLGTLADFRDLLAEAQRHGVEIALDLALQCSPDHPYVQEHPEWFRRLPDGTIRYAENPPKKYQDIYPLCFDTPDWQSLWQEIRRVVDFWVDQGVRIFRVDNPHTKPFAFWEWLIAGVQEKHADVIFLSEAFTRPKIMYRLAKLGFSQSYTYFAWRNTKWELEQYFAELTATEVREFFRPNLWPNTPDILTEYLQHGGRAAFRARLVLAALLGASYGVYGPAFELCEHRAREPGSEEYLDSEKYQLRAWDRDDPHSLRGLITRVNHIRREHRCLQSDRCLRFHPVDNPELICFSKRTDDLSEIIVVCVNLDPHHSHSGWVTLSTGELGLPEHEPYQVHDLLTEARYLWHGQRNFVELHPHGVPAHIFRVRRRVRDEREFGH